MSSYHLGDMRKEDGKFNLILTCFLTNKKKKGVLLWESNWGASST